MVGALLSAAPARGRRAARAIRRLAVALLCVAAGCTTGYRIDEESDAVGLPRPAAVYVYDFAVVPADVQLDRGGPLQRLAGALAGDEADPDAQAVALGRRVADALAADLVQRITEMGLPAQRLSRPDTPPEGALAVAGQFVSVDEGNRLRRMAIGFRQGQSSVTAQVQLYRVTGARAAGRLLDFTAVGTSPPTPGAVVTMGAGAAVQAGAAASGVKELTSSVESDTGRLAGEIARTLQTFFARQGWTPAPSAL